MRPIINQRYEFRPPGGDPAQPILIFGIQEFSPGQTQECDLWRVKTPQAFADKLEGQTECDSYGAVCRLLAGAFFGGDVARVADFIAAIGEKDAQTP
jgi:hypothetical protein